MPHLMAHSEFLLMSLRKDISEEHKLRQFNMQFEGYSRESQCYMQRRLASNSMQLEKPYRKAGKQFWLAESDIGYGCSNYLLLAGGPPQGLLSLSRGTRHCEGSSCVYSRADATHSESRA